MKQPWKKRQSTIKPKETGFDMSQSDLFGKKEVYLKDFRKDNKPRRDEQVPSQATLSGRTLGDIEREKTLKLQIEDLKVELGRIAHYLTCEECVLGLILDVERYGGSHCPWYLDLIDDDAGEEGYESCPDSNDFKIGSYWNQPDDKTTKEFIVAWLMWAQKKISEELTEAQNLLRDLSNRMVFPEKVLL